MHDVVVVDAGCYAGISMVVQWRVLVLLQYMPMRTWPTDRLTEWW